MKPRGTVVSVAAIACATWATIASRAAADERHVHAALDWSQATGCIDEGALRAGVEAHLGREVFAGAPDVRISGRVTRSHTGTDVVLELASTAGEPLGVRTLHAPRAGCRGLDRELVLVVSLLIDLRDEQLAEAAPAEAAMPPPAPPTPTPPQPSPPAPNPPAPTTPVVRPPVTTRPPSPAMVARAPTVVAPPRARGLPVALLVGAGLAVRELPGVAVAIRAGVELTPLPFLPVELGIAVWLPTAAERAGAGATFFGGVVRAGACLVAHADVVELGGCAAVEAGTVIAGGYGLDVSMAPWRPWVALSLRARVGVHVGPVVLRLEPGLAVPFVRDEFLFYDGATPVALHQAGVVAGTVDLLLVVPWGS